MSAGSHLALSSIFLRLLLAMLCGGAIGFEREWRSHAAGLRTHMLVCMSAAIVAILTIEITHHEAFSGNQVQVDPVRLIEAVTAGVAFLAAGVIVYTKGHVKGLTTGAGLWFAGAIGLSCGLGFWHIAVIATLMALTVLLILRHLSDKLNPNEDE